MAAERHKKRNAATAPIKNQVMTQEKKPIRKITSGKMRPGKAQKKANRPGGFFCVLCKSHLGLELEQEYRFHPKRKWRFDYAIPWLRIAIEVEGGVWTLGRHTRPEGFMGDMEKYNTAAIMGWRILRFTPDQLYTSATLDALQEAVKTE